MKLIYFTGLLLLASVSPAQQKSASTISKPEIQAAIQESTECDELKQIEIDNLEYFDFDGDGQQDAVVVASTCMTGTAGPDIHSVYTRRPDARSWKCLFTTSTGIQRSDVKDSVYRFLATPITA